jgi:chromate transporter
MIFLPGILGVYIVFPIWKQLRERKFFQVFLQGVVVAVTSLIVLTAITQAVRLPLYWDVWVVFLTSFFVLIQKKINPFLLLILLMLVGLIF